ncbi:MAG: PAS domain-containing protein [Candidatus Korobacteraceae bacterium]
MEESRTTKQDGLLAVVVAPSGRDAEVICDTLRDALIDCVSCRDLEQAEQYVAPGTGVIILAEEAFTPLVSEQFAAVLRSQPTWSEIPLIVLTVFGRSSEYSERMTSLRKPLGTALVLERPVRRETLAAAVQSALESRKRQYQLRNQIEALQESEEQFRALADTMGNLAWMARPDGYVYWYNHRWHEYTGMTLAETDGWGWKAVHDPADLPRVLDGWRSAIRQGKLFEMEFQLRGRDDVFRWFLTRAIPVRNSEGEVVRWFGTNTDVDELRQAQQALRLSQETLNAAIAASRSGTFRWDPGSGEFLEFGENLRKLFGLAPGESVRDTEDFLRRVHPDDRDAVAQASEQARHGANFEMEFRVVLPDGSSRWLYDRGENITNPDGSAGYLVGACTDVTDRKLAEEALRKTEKLAATGRLAATIAHEINNPLEAVTNLLYLARNHPNLDETVQDFLALADQELKRVSHLTKQTLGFYRESNKPSPIDPCALMDNVLQLYSAKLVSKGVSIARNYKGVGAVEAIEGEIRQVISNLLANAIDASERGSQITVTVAAAGNGDNREWATWEIADTGPGIPQEQLDKIFEPFFTTKRGIGTGLGLWVSKDLIAKQGGAIEIRTSTQPGTSGTSACVRLPLPAKSEASAT